MFKLGIKASMEAALEASDSVLAWFPNFLAHDPEFGTIAAIFAGFLGEKDTD